MIVGLELYKRHNCGLTDKQDYSCDCPIWITGNLPNGMPLKRMSTGERTLEAARIYRDAMIKANTPAGDDIKGLSIEAGLEEYLASIRGEVSEKVLAQYRLVVGRLTSFAAERNIHYLRELSVDLLDAFGTYGFEGYKSTTRAVGMSKIKAFLNDAYRRGWIAEPLSKRLKPYVGQYKQAEPFTEEEVSRILEGCGTMHKGNRGEGFASQPETFRLLLELQLETGMRCGDAVYFDPAKCWREGNLWVYRFVPQKTRRRARLPKTVDAYLKDRLKQAIDNSRWLSSSLPFAWGYYAGTSYLANEVYFRMRAIGNRVGVSDCRPHRLRDTFAVRMLAKGLTVNDLQVLLGHSSVKITEQYYAAWTPARSSLLHGKLTQALGD